MRLRALRIAFLSSILSISEHVGAFENGVVFKQCRFEPGITGMGVELSSDITLRIFLHDQ